MDLVLSILILILINFFNPLPLADSNVPCTLDKATCCPTSTTSFVNSQRCPTL